MTYKELDTVPAYVNDFDAKDQIRWINPNPPPAIGTEIIITMNRIGPAIVTGYFVEENFLGLLCRCTDPPDWHKKQNKGDPNGHIFGPEFKLP